MNEGLGRAVSGVHEDDVLWIAARGVDCQDDEWLLDEFWCAVDCPLLEENEFAGADFKGRRVAEEEGRSA